MKENTALTAKNSKSGSTQNKITLGITTYRGTKRLDSCLRSIQKSVFELGYSNFEVIVVDDGSQDTEIEKVVNKRLKKKKIRFEYVEYERQEGNVSRYNSIVENSSGDIIFLIDNDVIIPDRWFWSALYFLTENKCGVASYLSEKISQAKGQKLLMKRRIPAIGGGRVPERATELAGYCYGFTQENYQLVGGFDHKNFKYFCGDSDFCCRLAEEGLMSYRILYPVVYHIEHFTYDKYPELDAWNRAKEDIANFKKKWGCNAEEMEKQFLFKIQPQKIKWYANYRHHEDFDVEHGPRTPEEAELELKSIRRYMQRKEAKS